MHGAGVAGLGTASDEDAIHTLCKDATTTTNLQLIPPTVHFEDLSIPPNPLRQNLEVPVKASRGGPNENLRECHATAKLESG